MTAPLLELNQVSVRRGDTLVLKEVNLTILAGEKIILKGSNGSGKTTLLKTVLGLLTPERGGVTGNDAPAQGRFAYMPQELQNGDLPISVREVVAIGLMKSRLTAREQQRKILHLLEALDCGDLIDRSFATLSGGEKQRVSLARCLAQAPALLVLDEPTAGLDPEIRGRFFPLIEDLAECHGAGILLVTHDTAGIPLQGWRILTLEQHREQTLLKEVSRA